MAEIEAALADLETIVRSVAGESAQERAPSGNTASIGNLIAKGQIIVLRWCLDRESEFNPVLHRISQMAEHIRRLESLERAVHCSLEQARNKEVSP